MPILNTSCTRDDIQVFHIPNGYKSHEQNDGKKYHRTGIACLWTVRNFDVPVSLDGGTSRNRLLPVIASNPNGIEGRDRPSVPFGTGERRRGRAGAGSSGPQ